MPFTQHGNRAFTAVSVHRNAPSESGIYGLSNAREWVYVGECDDLRERLLEHLRERDGFVRAQNPTGFTYELCAYADRIARQEQLVRELEPVCNR